MDKMPKWADVILTPLISLLLAAAISALVILAIGESPWEALKTMVTGAMGSSYGWGFTLYYTTNFIFTGLAVAVAYHAALFNIGGEGQAGLGGLGVAIVCLFIPWPHWSLALLSMDSAIRASVRSRYAQTLETVMDEDRLETYKLMALRIKLNGHGTGAAT